jgi:hypothetical protein
MYYGVVVQYVDTTDVMPITFDKVEDAFELRDAYVKEFQDSEDEWAKMVYVICGERVVV